jgi:hypothetical protein
VTFLERHLLLESSCVLDDGKFLGLVETDPLYYSGMFSCEGFSWNVPR